MHNNVSKKILVIGSGPIVIGQAAEFDYAGTQGCLSLKEEGYFVILVNPNPATIMTDKNIADTVYMEPLTEDFVKWIISKEKPWGLLATLGGQTALNLAVKLHKSGILDKYNVTVLGTPISSIIASEDREVFRQEMLKIGQPIPKSFTVNSVSQALDLIEKKQLNLPVVIRPSYTLGGLGGGIVSTLKDLEIILKRGLELSPISQCLLEQSIQGFKEVEYEIMRDCSGNTISVCNMENIDPVGVHTGDSMVVAPSLTLTNKQFNMLRTASINIINHFGIIGGCNVQLALDTKTDEYYVIEINPRVSRSSALASKATGYPIAKVSSKLAVNKLLKDIIYNSKNPNVSAALEPAIDYIVTKIPRFAFDKFKSEESSLGTQMQATGETMAMGRTFEESFLKSLRGIENEYKFIWAEKYEKLSVSKLLKLIEKPNAYLFYQIIAILQKDETQLNKINHITKINTFFLNKFLNIIKILKNIKTDNLTKEILFKLKKYGISDYAIAKITNKTEQEIFHLRKQMNVLPVYKIVDTCAAEFKAATPYFYSTYSQENESIVSKKKKIIIVGSGPIRIGQGVEFDYSTVHCIWAIQKLGYEAIIINNNPETVSTDYSVGDKLYFEPLTFEDVMNIINHEQPEGIILQFGGQTALNLSQTLKQENIKILGTSLEAINISEDRKLFAEKMNEIEVLTPPSYSTSDFNELENLATKIGYPIMVRPSYVIGGKSMEIIESPKDLKTYLSRHSFGDEIKTLLVDRYVLGIEAEIDAVSDGTNIFIPGVMEHIEKAGIHSGDSTAVYPTYSLSEKVLKEMCKITLKICKSLKVIGLINIQFIIWQEKIYVLEINLRSSRTIPFLSKATNINIVELATKVIMGHRLKEFKLPLLHKPKDNRYFIKAPVFSFIKLWKVADALLGPEMKSTGEAIGIDRTLEKALYKALLSAHIDVLRHHSIAISVNRKLWPNLLKTVLILSQLGYKIYATKDTSLFLTKNKIPNEIIHKIGEKNNIIDLIKKTNLSFIVNIPGNKSKNREDYKVIRSKAIEKNIAVISSIDLFEKIAVLCHQMKYLIKEI